MSNNDIIWDLRTDKILEALKHGKRLDGRKFDEYRKILAKANVSENADGSASVKIGNTEVIVGIKMVPGEPFPDTPNEGTISVMAELLPLASPTFEAGPPREEATELARVVDRGIRESKCIDFEGLCIREGELVWVVFIDLYALNQAGNLFDASALAAIKALNETRIPKLEDDKIVSKEYSGKLKVLRKPVLSTFAKLGNSIVVDPTIGEEHALDARFSVATTEDEYFSAFQKGGSGSFTKSEISECLETALRVGKELRKKI